MIECNYFFSTKKTEFWIIYFVISSPLLSLYRGQTRGELYPNVTFGYIDTAVTPLAAEWFCDKFAPNLEPYEPPPTNVKAELSLIHVWFWFASFFFRLSFFDLKLVVKYRLFWLLRFYWLLKIDCEINAFCSYFFWNCIEILLLVFFQANIFSILVQWPLVPLGSLIFRIVTSMLQMQMKQYQVGFFLLLFFFIKNHLIHTSILFTVVGLGERYGVRPDYKTMEDVQSLQLVAMRDMYLRYPEGKWYYIVGDDMFVVVDELRRMLVTYDETLDYWLVNYSGTRILPDNFNTTEWPNRVPMIDQKKIFAWQVSPFLFLPKFFLYTNNRGVNSLLFVFVLVILQRLVQQDGFSQIQSQNSLLNT